MDLKSFSNTDDYAGYRDESVLKEKETKQQEPEQEKKITEQDVRETIGKYAKFSNDELMVELMKQVALQKGKGNAEGMKSTIERIKPFLNAEQQKRLEAIIKQMNL
ncbi:MAG: hypothetical protein FWE01_01295 [Firmicutes bacterium]|nr:hypothetical protein [Bacillota bacterium]